MTEDRTDLGREVEAALKLPKVRKCLRAPDEAVLQFASLYF
jgi:hypothetical protein